MQPYVYVMSYSYKIVVLMVISNYSLIYTKYEML